MVNTYKEVTMEISKLIEDKIRKGVGLEVENLFKGILCLSKNYYLENSKDNRKLMNYGEENITLSDISNCNHNNNEDLKGIILELAKRAEEENDVLDGILIKYFFKDIENVPDTLLLEIINIVANYVNSENDIRELSDEVEGLQKKNSRMDVYASKSIERVLALISDYKPNSKIINPYARKGRFLVNAKDYINNIYGNDLGTKYYAFDINQLNINEIRYNLFINDIYNYDLQHADILISNKIKDYYNTCDNVVVDPPLSIRWDNKICDEDIVERYEYGIPSAANADWAFIQVISKFLNSTGKATIVVSKGTLVRRTDMEIRKNFIKADLVEAVISLPASLYYGTGIAVELLVLNKNKAKENKEKILFINASEEFKKENNNQNFLSNYQIDKLIDVYRNNKEIDKYSKIVPIKYIEENDYSLNSIEYLEYKDIKKRFEKSIMLGAVSEIKRGIAITRDDLRELSNCNGYCYLNLKNIQSGEICYESAEKIELKSPQWLEKYAVRENDIIVNAKGSSIKCAIVKKGFERAIISSNLIIIRVNKDIYNPQLVYKLLTSDYGKRVIDSIVTGSTMKVISTSKLTDVLLPEISLEEGNKIAKMIISNNETYENEIKSANDKYAKNNQIINSLIGL